MNKSQNLVEKARQARTARKVARLRAMTKDCQSMYDCKSKSDKSCLASATSFVSCDKKSEDALS